MSTVEFNQTSSDGIDLRAWVVTLNAGDTGPDAFEHDLPFTPTLVVLTPRLNIGSAWPGIAIAVTPTTCTITKINGVNTGGTYTLYLGRASNPQMEG